MMVALHRFPDPSQRCQQLRKSVQPKGIGSVTKGPGRCGMDLHNNAVDAGCHGSAEHGLSVERRVVYLNVCRGFTFAKAVNLIAFGDSEATDL